MKCEKCGKEVSADEIICPYCGAVNFTSKKEQDADASIQVDKLESRQTTAPISPKHNENTSPKGINHSFSQIQHRKTGKQGFQKQRWKSIFFPRSNKHYKINHRNRSTDHWYFNHCFDYYRYIDLHLPLRRSYNDIFFYGADIYYVTNAGDSIDLRQSADNDSDSLATLYSGSAVELVDKTNEDYWEGYGLWGGGTGYLPTQNLTGDTGRINEGDLSEPFHQIDLFLSPTPKGWPFEKNWALTMSLLWIPPTTVCALGGHRANKQYVLAGLCDFQQQIHGLWECAYLTEGLRRIVRSGALPRNHWHCWDQNRRLAESLFRPSANEKFCHQPHSKPRRNQYYRTDQSAILVDLRYHQQFAYCGMQ